MRNILIIDPINFERFESGDQMTVVVDRGPLADVIMSCCPETVQLCDGPRMERKTAKRKIRKAPFRASDNAVVIPVGEVAE